MLKFFSKLAEDKAEYRQQKARIAMMPEPYRFVLEKMSAYMWSQAGGSGRDTLNTYYDLIDLFEENAQRGRDVLEVTGPDVAAFCDALMEGNTQWIDRFRKRANRF